MNMLGHQNIACNDKSVPQTRAFKRALEDRVSSGLGQQRLPSITTEGKKVEDAALLVANKSLRHCTRSLS
jgi:hypothetical protein